MNDIFDLKGRTAVITGSTKGMGFAMARALGIRGASVVVSGRTDESSQGAAALLATEGIDAAGISCDVTSAESLQRFSSLTLERFPRVDALILNAAGDTPVGSIMGQTSSQVDSAVSVNLRAALSLVNAFAPQMVGNKEGSIVFMSSRAAKRGSAFLGLYAMSKAALDQYVRNLALELGPSGINVNSINPGPVRTDFSKDALWGDPEKEAKLAATIPMRRIADASDVAGLAVLLVSPAGRYIHGQNISVDGGMTA